MQGVSVFSPRVRTPAGGRSRCGFAKQIRGFSAQTSDSKRMRCLSNFCWPCPAPTDPPTREESNSAQGAGVRKTPQQRRVGCVFPMTAQAESGSRNPRPDWDSFSGWRLKRKLRPGIRAQNGTRFPTGGPSGKYIPESPLKTGRAFRSISSTPKPMRPPFQNWVEEGQNAIAGGQYDCRR